MTTTKQFSVTGMTCDNCVRHVKEALEKVNGVSGVQVNLDQQSATVDFDPNVATVEGMAATLKDEGYTLGEKAE